MPLTRRGFLGQAAPWAFVPLLSHCGGTDTTDIAEPPFLHGVASGDPSSSGVLLWTRVTLEGSSEPVLVEWVVALDPALAQVVATGGTTTGADADYTLTVEVAGLSPATTHYYQFRALGQRSLIGRTKTLPEGPAAGLRVAVVSCANYPAGYFHAYRLIAERDDIDLVLHLGDYIYEYGEGQYGTGAPLGRVPDPEHESVALGDYRLRHAQYKADPDLQALHRQHPMVAIWDDHEVANDAYRDGAQNHQPASEGSYAERKAAAQRAYFEWMPTRRNAADPARIFRSVQIGDLADLIVLDTRHYARDRQPADACDPSLLGDPSRALLGSEQSEWLRGELTRSQARGATWRLIGQQVMLGQLLDPRLGPNCVANVDQWDGYAAERARLLGVLREAAIDNVVILTGDIHSSWAIDISDNPFDPSVYDPATGAGSLAVEIVTPAVTSPGPVGPEQAPQLEAVLAQTHPHIKYAELLRQGYVVLDVNHDRISAEWYHVGDVRSPDVSAELAASVEARAGDNHLTRV